MYFLSLNVLNSLEKQIFDYHINLGISTGPDRLVNSRFEIKMLLTTDSGLSEPLAVSLWPVGAGVARSHSDLDWPSLRPDDELVSALAEVVPLAEDVLLLLGLHHVLLLQALQGEHTGGVRLTVAVLTRGNMISRNYNDFVSVNSDITLTSSTRPNPPTPRVEMTSRSSSSKSRQSIDGCGCGSLMENVLVFFF